MKKRLCVLALLLTLFMSACGGSETPTPTEAPSPVPTPTPTKEAVTEEILSKGTGFLITVSHGNGTTKYNYTITANDGTVIESASCPTQPQVAPIGKNLLGLRFSSDKGSWCRYYDVEKGLASRSFYGAFWDNGELVAYNDFEKNGCLAVESIFDENGYSHRAKIDSIAMELTIIAAVPSEDGSVLTVEYYLGRSGDRMTVELPLR